MSGIYNMFLNVAPREREKDQDILCKKKILKEKYKLRDFSNVLAVIQYNAGLLMMFNNIQKCIKYKKEKRGK